MALQKRIWLSGPAIAGPAGPPTTALEIHRQNYKECVVENDHNSLSNFLRP